MLCRTVQKSKHRYDSVPGGIRSKHKYYGNTKQGIYANVKDGLRLLQMALEDALAKNGDNPIAGAVWRYNLSSMWRPEKGQRYLERVAGRSTKLSEYLYKIIIRYLKDIVTKY